MKERLAIYPDVAVVAIKLEIVPEFRTWLSFHAASQNGVMFTKDAYEIFTSKKSPYYLFGKKRMKQVLRNGEGLFWQTCRDNSVIRLAGKDVLAERLNIERLGLLPVYLETKYLFKSYKHTKAALLDAVYVSHNNPVSRIFTDSESGISVTTQKELEKLIGTKVSPNYLVIDESESKEDIAWKYSSKVVTRLDTSGKVTGEKGSLYLAAKMSNTYTSVQSPAGKGSLREYNKKNSSRRIPRVSGKSKRLYSTPESRSSKAVYEKVCDVFSQSTKSVTRLGYTGIWAHSWR